MGRMRYISFQNSDILIALNMSVLVRIIAKLWGKKGREEREMLYATFREDKKEFEYVRLSWLYERLYNVI